MNKISNNFRWCMGLCFFMLILCQIPLLSQSGINEFGSFEQGLPSYWTKGSEPGGATLSWATDQSIDGQVIKDNKDSDTRSSDVGIREYV